MTQAPSLLLWRSLIYKFLFMVICQFCMCIHLYTCTCISFQYQVPREGVSWATLFRTLEENKKDLQIEDYLVSQTTLEQVFIYFARAQIDPVDFQAGCCNRFQQSCCFCCTAEYIKASSANLQT